MNETRLHRFIGKCPDWLYTYCTMPATSADLKIKWQMFRLDQLIVFNYHMENIYQLNVQRIKYKYTNYRKALLQFMTIKERLKRRSDDYLVNI